MKEGIAENSISLLKLQKCTRKMLRTVSSYYLGTLPSF